MAESHRVTNIMRGLFHGCQNEEFVVSLHLTDEIERNKVKTLRTSFCHTCSILVSRGVVLSAKFA